jgi:hypothetical protein
MKGFRNRAAQKARHAASGGDGPPAGQEPQAPGAAPAATTADRGAARKRLRRVKATRDVALHELGALVMEMQRQGRHDPALVERKAREAVAADAEFRALGGALDRDEPLTSAGGGLLAPCSSCGAPVGGADRFCSRCGTPVAAGAVPPAQAAPPPSPDARIDAPPPTAATRVDGMPAAAPPSSSDRVEAAPPSASERIDAPPPAPGDRSDGAPPDDGVPTFTVTR